jgi:tetratricopeptide (TPR) repeat protein
LGLIFESEGLYDEAEHHYLAALAEAKDRGWEVEMAYSQNDLGALYLHLNRPDQAVSLLETAHATWTAYDETLLQAKSGALLGLALLAIGKDSRAQELAQSSLDVFASGVPVGEQPQAWLWALYRLLSGLKREAAAGEVLQSGYDELQRQAYAISDPGLRKKFFYNVPLNYSILVASDKHAARNRAISIKLARRAAPLGRTLEADELVTVKWTINAPEDEAFSKKDERRRHRLMRLLQEAQQQGGAPTDDNLASALGVSRRTILRDLQFLADKLPISATRKRKKRRPSAPDKA